MNKIKGRLLPVLTVLLALVLVLLMIWAEKQDEQRRIELENIYGESLKVTDENSINIVSASEYTVKVPDGAKCILKFEDIQDKIERTNRQSGRIAAMLNEIPCDDPDSIYLLNFKMKARKESAVVEVKFGTSHTWYVGTQWNEYWMPYQDGKIDKLHWILRSDFQIIELADIYIYQLERNTTDFTKIPCGTYLCDNVQVNVTEREAVLLSCEGSDIVYAEGYLYVALKDAIEIYECTPDGKLLKRGEATNLGLIRHIAISEQGILGVAARSNGVYLVDVADKDHPVILSHYQTLEMANDVCFAGHYMIVAGRYFGVEFVDIGDVKKPEFVTKVAVNRECYRVEVKNRYLFVSCWATGEIFVYDISNISIPKKLALIEVDGRCGGIAVEGDFLYAVSGYTAKNNNTRLGDPGYGTGNGMTVFDISDASHPKQVAVVKNDGSQFSHSYDDWVITVSNGYAYFTASYDGVYVYDVTNPRAPKRVQKIAFPLFKGQSVKYRNLNYNYSGTIKNQYVFPYDTDVSAGVPILSVCPADEMIYIASPEMGIYSYAFEQAKALLPEDTGEGFKQTAVKKTVSYKNVEYYFEDKMIYAVKRCGRNYFVGCDEGILILNEKMELLGQVKTVNYVKDISIVDDYLYTAETDGVGVYLIRGSTLKKIGYCEANGSAKNVSSIAVTPDGNFILLQAGFTNLQAMSFKNKNSNPILVKNVVNSAGEVVNAQKAFTIGTMYYRNLVTSNGDGIIGAIGNSGSVWCRSLGDTLQVVGSYPNCLYREEGGHVGLPNSNQILSVCKNGYVLYDPTDGDKITLDQLPVRKVQEKYVRGKPSVNGDILVISYESNGSVWILDISDSKNPTLIGEYETHGNPDIACITNHSILIPAKRAGLMLINY